MSDHLDLGKTVDLKKEGLYDQLRNDSDVSKQRDNMLSDIDGSGNVATSSLDDSNISDSELKTNIFPISNIDIERIGSPNKPKHDPNVTVLTGIDVKKQFKDTRQKLDDEDDDENIITGSHSVNNSTTQADKTITSLEARNESMSDYLNYSKASLEDKDTGDLKVLVDDIMKGLVKDLDTELFPQRPLFLLTADLTNISLEQATTLLNDLTPEKERIIVEKIIETQNRNKKKSKSNKMVSDTGKLVLFEKKGIQTDLVSIEDYIQTAYKFILNHKKKVFLKEVFTSVKHDSFELLNQLQNSDIGSYEHFDIDYSNIAVLNLETYLEVENYKKKLIVEEESKDTIGSSNTISSNDELVAIKVNRKKRKRYEFDESSLSDKQIQEKKKLFRECEHIHNKALFDGVNEALLQFRPYGKDGEPAPWSSKKRQLQKRPHKSKLNLKKMFEIVRHDMFRWGIMQAGTLPRKDFIFGGTFDEDLFNEIREKKLATLLATEVIENECKWLNYEFEEAQVRIDLGDMILEQLVSECIACMNVIDSTERKKSVFTDKELVDQLVVNE